MDQDQILKAAAEAAQGMQNGAMNVPPIQPQPVPMSMQIQSAQGADGKQFVVLVTYTPMGQTILFFDPEGAERIGQGLIDTARVARTGLEIPRF